jgi:transposase
MKHYIGIDVSKQQLDVDWLGKPLGFTNDNVGITKLIERLQLLIPQEQLALILCEASGGYEQKIVRACHKVNLPIHVVHANKIRYFAKSQGIKAKTDQIDAKVISAYGSERKPEADHFFLNENTDKIRELLKRREQLLADKKRENSRLDKIDSPDIKELVESHIEWLNGSLKKLEDILSQLQKSDDVKESHTLLKSIPGIGSLLASYFMAYLPELGKLSHKAIAALVGVAPFNHDSGTHQGKRFIQGGRSVLRQMLYMAAMTSITWNADLKTFYERLRTNGKPGKIALVAVMRKLLSMANSVMLRKSPWQKSLVKNL